MNTHYLSIDLGASSGRVFVTAWDGMTLTQHETYRFPNRPVRMNGRLSWDFDALYDHILQGMAESFAEYPDIRHVGIDTFGVDFGLLGKDGQLLRQPVSYRDGHAKSVTDEVNRLFDDRSLYERTGIQHLDFNTVYQLYHLKKHEPSLFEDVEHVALLPDLIAYKLTGRLRSELTNLSTTSLLDARERSMTTILKRLGIRSDLFADIIRPGEVYGSVKPDLKKRMGIDHDVDVVAVCTHDTASAVASISHDGDMLYASSGTWSLIGTLLDAPLIDDETKQHNFTNEIGYRGQIRFLKNAMGLWLFDHAFAEYKATRDDIELAGVLKRLDDPQIPRGVIDIDDDALVFPDGYLDAVRERLRRNHGGEASVYDDLAVLKSILFSMAVRYDRIIEALETMTGQHHTSITIIGGGTKNDVLNQMIADVTEKEIIIGPKEATALGNALVLMQHDGVFGDIRKDFDWTEHGEVSRFKPSGVHVNENERKK